MEYNELVFFVNGIKIQLNDFDVSSTLLEFLRKKRFLTGTKLACGEGGCGACTVLASKYITQCDTIHHFSLNACLTPLASVHGYAITTVEGIGNIQEKIHPIQQRLADYHGSQCGFCTPGMVMSMYALLRNSPTPSKQEIIDALDGNLCRCTGYRPILDALNTFSKECSLGKNCCRNSTDTTNTEITKMKATQEDSMQEVIFPPELKLVGSKLDSDMKIFKSDDCIWCSPVSLNDLVTVRKMYPTCVLVCGNTEIGVEAKLKLKKFPILVSTNRISEMKRIETTDSGILIGGSVTLSAVKSYLKNLIKTLPEHKTSVFSALFEMLRWFAGNQIRNVASLAGNIFTASPISDLNPLLLVCKAVLSVMNQGGQTRKVQMNEDFFTSYRKTVLEPADTIVSIFLPFSSKGEYTYGFKQAIRKEDDISVVNAGMYVKLEGNVVKNIRLAFGGMAHKTVMAPRTMKTLTGREWNKALLEVTCSETFLEADLPLAPGSPGGMVAYRRTLAHSFFYKFFCHVTLKLYPENPEAENATKELTNDPLESSQIFKIPKAESCKVDSVGHPIVHRAARKQCTGEALFVDDITPQQGELFCGFVLSSKAHAKILSVDATASLALDGVFKYVSHTDVPGNNCWDDVDDLVFAASEVTHQGQVIGVVVADSLKVAQRAAALVKVEYEEVKPVVSIRDAIENESFFEGHKQVIECGNVVNGFSGSDHVIEGETHVGAQEHFYLEPHACIVYPVDQDEYEVVCSTQGLDAIQVGVASTLGISENQVKVTVKRIGGGFGGKETRHNSVVLPTAVAASITKRPVRSVLERHEDMRLTGTRHPVLAKYKVGFTKAGKLQALEVTVYFNCGMSRDLSVVVGERCLLVMGSAYNIPNTKIESRYCKTNISSCTAFRGFGSPQGILVVEQIMHHVAEFLNIDPQIVIELNMHKEGGVTSFGQTLSQNNLTDCWNKCKEKTNIEFLKEEVANFNRNHRWQKRGISMTPLTYGIGFPKLCLNKASCLVNVYRDGSVLLSIGGVEMGQGLHTKMIQIASKELNLPIESIRIRETTTDAIPNATATAGSMSSDLYGMAVLKACRKLKEELKPLLENSPQLPWKRLIQTALDERKGLTVVAHYNPVTSDMDWSSSTNSPFQYFSYGAACSVVEIDCLTGDHKIIETDIVMDVGQSLNPAIDIGQIEGAFMQGVGMLILEQYNYTPDGTLLSKGPGNYKIPSFSNIPQKFHVSLLETEGNPKAVHSSKAIGEPPLCLASSVFFAVKDAIRQARKESEIQGYFRLDSPATPDRIRMSCTDQFSTKFAEEEKNAGARPWFLTNL